MKIFKLLAIAFVAMLSFSSCTKDCEHDFIEYDYSEALIGTWTIIEEGQAEAMVINPDGSFEVTGVMQGGSLYESKGTIKVVNNKVLLVFEGDKDVTEGRLELVAGKSLSIVINEEYDIRLTYDYCKNDLSDEIIGMWVCTETPSAEENDMLIMTYKADGTTSFSGYFYEADDFGANKEASYKVIGDLLIHKQPDIALEMGLVQYTAMRIKYTPNANSLGDMMSLNTFAKVGENYVETTTSWLRVKQSLDLEGKKYDYIKTYISNIKGENQDIPFFNTTINFANLDNAMFDKFLKATLFAVQFPDANTIEYSFLMGEQLTPMKAPIEVEGNKMTIKMSELNDVYRDIDIYTFQDQDDSQMHMYMHTASFENFLGNMQVNLMDAQGQLDITDKAAVEDIFSMVENAIQSINVSFVMTKSSTTKAL